MLVTKKAPDFTAKAVLGNNEVVEFNLYNNLGKGGAVVFFYPLDFTFVCPTELGDMADKYAAFQKMGVEANEFIEKYRKFWEDSFDRLEIYLRKLQAGTLTPQPPLPEGEGEKKTPSPSRRGQGEGGENK